MNKIYFLIIKFLVCIILFLSLGIICKSNVEYKNYIQKKIYQEHFDFFQVKFFYDKYLGGIFPIENISNNAVVSVFSEDLVYQSFDSYKDGVMLDVDYKYLVPVIEKGLVVYVGEKDDYGNVVIIEGENGIDIWYGNLCNIMVKIYDSVSGGSYLGESCDNKIYVVYTKKNEFLDYKDYLK